MDKPLKLDYAELTDRIASDLIARRHIAYAQISSDLTVLQASPNFSDMLREPVESIEGQKLSGLFWEFIEIDALLQRILQGEIPEHHMELINRPTEKNPGRYLDFWITPLDRQHPGQGLLLIIEDSSPSGQLQQLLAQDRNELRLVQIALEQANTELQRLDRLKSVSMLLIAHDLRTPLAAISGYIDFALESVDPDSQAELFGFLSAARSQTDRLEHLLNDFIDLDLFEYGKLPVYPMPCAPAEIIPEVVETLKEFAKRQGITVAVELPDAPIRLLADPTRMQQIIYNLLSNAIKYTPKGGHVQVTAACQDQQAVIQVKDNGRGVSQSELGRLFELYYRTPQAIKSPARGSGIGLYIVKILVEAQNGHVEADSQAGQGTTFTVRLPLAHTH